MSPVTLEEASAHIVDFLKFARSRPSNEDLGRALSKVLTVPRHAAITSELENALLEIRELYPDLAFIEFHLAILPARNDDNFRASELLEEFVDKFSTNIWGYLKGIEMSRAANLYQRADRIASQALERLDELSPFGPTEFSALLVEAGQIGRHRLFFELYNRFGKWLSETPPYSASRFDSVAENLRAETYEHITFMSLGTNCLPWAVGNRWGLRPLLTRDNHQLPLNYGQQTAQSCALMLDDGFERLSDSSQYVLTPGPYGFDIAMHKGYRFMFNHEVGRYWLAEGCKNLVERYSQRSANFFKYAIKGPRVYVLYLPWSVDIEAIERKIGELSVDENYRLLVIDSRAVAEHTQPSHPNTIWRKVSMPYEKYIWWHHFDTEEGVRFEAAIHDAMREAARELVT